MKIEEKRRNHKFAAKKILFVTIGILGLFGVATFTFNIDSSKAAANSTLYISPASSPSISVGSDFHLDVYINPGTNQATGAELHLTYPQLSQNTLRLDSIDTTGSAFPNVLQAANINNASGTASIVIAVNATTPVVPVTTTSKIATLNFHALGTVTNAQIAFDASQTYATALGEGGDVLTARTPATVTVIVPDTTPPTLTMVTAVTTPTNDTTPDYIFNTNEAGTIQYGGDCSSSTKTTATVGSNTVTFNALAAGAHSNCTIKVTDAANNQSAALAVNTFTVDTTPPTLTMVTSVTTPTNDTTPDYIFNTNEAGTIQYGGDCSSSTKTTATVGSNTVTFNALAAGAHSNCTIKVTDVANNQSAALAVNTFTIDTTPPTAITVTPISSTTKTKTPSYIINANEAGSIQFGGDCSSSTTSVTGGTNTTIVFNTLAIGNHTNCTIKVIDSAGNQASIINVPAFAVTYPADTDNSHSVTLVDYNTLLTNFGSVSSGNVADFNADNKVNLIDYNILLGDFGKSF